jgi:hypothetical protein
MRERGAETSGGDGGIGEIELESAACSRSVYYPIAIGLQAARRVRVVPLTGIAPTGRGSRNADTLPKCIVSLPWRPTRTSLRA